MRRAPFLARGAALVIAAAVTSSCTCRPRSATTGSHQEDVARAESGPTRLVIRLHHGIGIRGYTYEGLLPALRGLDPGQAVVTFTERDVAEYRVSDQPGRVVFVLDDAASSRMRSLAPPGETLRSVCGEGPFTVSLDGELLYGGLCYQVVGAAALRHPVLHVEAAGDRIELRIGDVQGRWGGFSAGDEASAHRVAPPQLTALFEARGRLRPLP